MQPFILTLTDTLTDNVTLILVGCQRDWALIDTADQAALFSFFHIMLFISRNISSTPVVQEY